MTLQVTSLDNSQPTFISTSAGAQSRLFLILIFTLSIATSVHANVLAELRGAYIKSDTITETFPIEISDPSREYGISVTAILDTGSGSLQVKDPTGTVIYQHLWSTRRSQERARLPITHAGKHVVEVTVEKSRGEWRARIVPLPPRTALKHLYASIIIMAAIALVAAALVYRRGAPMRYLFVGAAIFIAARILWFIGAVALELTTRYALEDAMPYRGFIWLQSVVLGLWQGVAVTLVVVLTAVLTRSLRDKPIHSIALGIGASACEMLITAVISLLGMLVLFIGAKSDRAQFNLAYDMAVTPLLPIAEPLILALQMMCIVAGTVLVVSGIQTKRFASVAGGGLVFAATLTVVSASRTITLFGPESRWVIVGVLVPIAALSYLVLRRNLQTRQVSPIGGETAMDAFLRENDAAAN
ncbi:MAG: hypothetical protein IT366_10690 [Candidatus Hydrogenedentes bacterium]|nr:hypothetical protein [Candidatus Hydrogenedentota bacterium]